MRKGTYRFCQGPRFRWRSLEYSFTVCLHSHFLCSSSNSFSNIIFRDAERSHYKELLCATALIIIGSILTKSGRETCNQSFFSTSWHPEPGLSQNQRKLEIRKKRYWSFEVIIFVTLSRYRESSILKRLLPHQHRRWFSTWCTDRSLLHLRWQKSIVEADVTRIMSESHPAIVHVEDQTTLWHLRYSARHVLEHEKK